MSAHSVTVRRQIQPPSYLCQAAISLISPEKSASCVFTRCEVKLTVLCVGLISSALPSFIMHADRAMSITHVSVFFVCLYDEIVVFFHSWLTSTWHTCCKSDLLLTFNFLRSHSPCTTFVVSRISNVHTLHKQPTVYTNKQASNANTFVWDFRLKETHKQAAILRVKTATS